MRNTWLSSRNVLKIGCGLALLFFSFYIPSIVYAGELNSAESRVISAARGTFEYEGKKYRAAESYINQVIAILNQDGMDLTSEEADSLIYQIYASVGEGVNSGYLYEVKGSSEDKTEGNKTENPPNQKDDSTEDTSNQKNDSTDDTSNQKNDSTDDTSNKKNESTGDTSNQKNDLTDDASNQQNNSSNDSSNQKDGESNDGSNEKSDMADQEDLSGEDEKFVSNNQSSDSSQDSTSVTTDGQVFKETGFYLGRLRYIGVGFSFILAGMLLATILLKRNISRGEHDK